MKAVTFYFKNMNPTQSLHRLALLFLTFMVDLTFGKMMNMQEDDEYAGRAIFAHVTLRCTDVCRKLW